MIGLANGGGSSTLAYLKKTLIQTATKIEPDVKKIIGQAAIRAIGCSQEQTFEGITSETIRNYSVRYITCRSRNFMFLYNQ